MPNPEHPEGASQDVTALLLEWADGDPQAGGRLLELIYDELRIIAAQRLRHEHPPITLQPTELVHEAYLRLIDQKRFHWQNRSHFFAIASKMMRRVLVDRARSQKSGKRGGGRRQVALEDVDHLVACSPEHLLTLDRALEELAAVDPGKVEIVELRIFGGLAFEEIARHLGMSTATLNRHWRIAKSWIWRYLYPETG